MRHLLSASIFAVAAAWALPGQAASVAFDSLPMDGSYYAPSAVSHTGSYDEHVTGNTSSRTSPFSDDSTYYDSVGADGKATFGLGLTSPPEDLFRAAYTNGPASSTFGIGSGTFTFVWGTPDSYNNLFFYSGGNLVDQVMGGSGSPNNGSGSYLATVSGLGNYDTVVFQSVGQNAFEFAAVSPVPLPASLPMFGAAVLVLGGLRFAFRGRAASRVAAG